MELLLPILALTLLGSAAFYFIVVNGAIMYPTLPNLTFLMHFLYVVGMATTVMVESAWDHDWVLMNLLGPVFMVIGAFTANAVFRFDPKCEWVEFQRRPLSVDLSGVNYVFVVGSIVLVSIGVLAAYTIASGENMVISALRRVVSGDNVFYVALELTEKRKALTSGMDGYWAPGYLKQFRDVLLPCVTMFVYCRWKLTGGPAEKRLFWVLFLSTFYFMLGSGQRAPIFLFFVAMCLVAWNLPHKRNLHNRRKFPKWMVAPMVSTFVLMTYLLGREETGGNPLAAVGQGIYNLYDRIVVMVPRENILSKPVWEQIGPLNGMGWWEGILQILPGTQTSIYNDLHAYLGGSEQGNSILNLWAETWINFGMLGVLVVGLVFGFWLQAVHVRYVRRENRGLRHLVHYCFMACILPLVNQPVTYLIYGGLTLGILSLLFRFGDLIQNTSNRAEIPGMRNRAPFGSETTIPRPTTVS